MSDGDDVMHVLVRIMMSSVMLCAVVMPNLGAKYDINFLTRRTILTFRQLFIMPCHLEGVGPPLGPREASSGYNDGSSPGTVF